jgi:hypothetical protein
MEKTCLLLIWNSVEGGRFLLEKDCVFMHFSIRQKQSDIQNI